MATSNHPSGNPIGPASDPLLPAPKPAGPTAKPAPKVRRWLKVIFLGVFLGAVYIAYNLSLVTIPQLGPPSRTELLERETTPFKLADEKLQQQVIKVIGGQLAAFRQEDYPAAYAFAAADFKAQVTLAAFERLVKTGFPQIARSRSAEYGIILENGREAEAEVTIVGETGTRIHYQYILRREHGEWKIGGVNEGQSEKGFI